MNLDLADRLPELVPHVIDWARARAAEIAAEGRVLTDTERSLARRVGVVHAERVRVRVVDEIPMPTFPLLRRAALDAGLLDANRVGLTLGHGIYVCHGHASGRLLTHECRHVYQYEQTGSIATYLRQYLEQIVRHGYAGAPYEIDARAHEVIGNDY